MWVSIFGSHFSNFFRYCYFGPLGMSYSLQLLITMNYPYISSLQLSQASLARAERRIVESAVRQNGLALEWASEDLRADRDVAPWWEVSWGEWQRLNFSKNLKVCWEVGVFPLDGCGWIDFLEFVDLVLSEGGKHYLHKITATNPKTKTIV